MILRQDCSYIALQKYEALRTTLGLAKTVYIYTVYARIFGDIPANNTVYTPYINGSGQPYINGICQITLSPMF